jgi:anti-sigma regulatory factor (Ser/Thr protein kinase)/anti-anti-sigma regulatory factor
VNQQLERDLLELVTTLQDAVQPVGVPVLPNVDIEGRCWVSRNASEPGGSWFDVVTLPDGRLAMVVGEAPGLGLHSSITAAQMRAVIQAEIRRDGDAVTALRFADNYAQDLRQARGTTAAIVLLDPDNESANYACAGHWPPLLLPVSGAAQSLRDVGGGPLGAGVGAGYASATCQMSLGDAILLAGAPAHRSMRVPPGGSSGDWSALTFEDLDRVVGEFAQHMAVDDTLCVVAARLRTVPHRALGMKLDSQTDPLSRARIELGNWLIGLGASPMDQMALTHAAAELVTNAVEHSGQVANRPIELRARLGTDGWVAVEVIDHGTWQEPSGDLERGRGLAMAAGLVDHLGVSVRRSGTHAILRHRLVHPVPIGVVEQISSPMVPDTLDVVRTAPRTVVLRGAFNHDDVERVAAEILVVARGGTVPLSLDLTGVTRISTSAVSLLAYLSSTHRAIGMDTSDINIIAATNSVTQKTLEIARVPHRSA